MAILRQHQVDASAANRQFIPRQDEEAANAIHLQYLFGYDTSLLIYHSI